VGGVWRLPPLLLKLPLLRLLYARLPLEPCQLHL
jgi:hypothetical protein